MPPHRKVAFSNKQKKEQLKAKRERKQNTKQDDDDDEVERHDKKERSQASGTVSGVSVHRINQQPSTKLCDEANRYRLHFASDSSESVAAGKRQARLPLNTLTEESLESCIEDFYPVDIILDMPKRPAWDYRMTQSQLEHNEECYFKEYVQSIVKKCAVKSYELSYFELNLETWRQLWRVIEMSDIVLLIADIRFPAVHFSPVLYNYVVNELNKYLILVLNKVDLVAVDVVIAWKHYFTNKFPQLKVIYFTSRPTDSLHLNLQPTKVLQRRKHSKKSFAAIGPEQLFTACQVITNGAVELDSWSEKLCADTLSVSGDELGQCHIQQQQVDAQVVADIHPRAPRQLFDGGLLTIGCCGFPNVGKSSVINALMGKKVVSVSRTPGHTKHFQTIFLTQQVRLCDSPGLVFPSIIPRPLQVLAGVYPIAQLREPYSAIKFLAERLSLVVLLRLKHEQQQTVWTPYDICEAWAVQRGFLTAKAARPDIYRAANNILRLALESRLCLSLRPPGYLQHKVEWMSHSETYELINLLQTTIPADNLSPTDTVSDCDTEGSQQEEQEGATRARERDSAASNSTDTDDDDLVSSMSTQNPFNILSHD